MDSIINEKRQLHETLLKFPPFFTYLRGNIQLAVAWRVSSQADWVLGRTDSHSLQRVKNELQRHNIINSSLSEICNLPLLEDRSTPVPSIHNTISERLSKEDTLVVLKDLERLGCVEFVIGSEKILISHFSPYEMADDMYRWAKKNYFLGDVETL